MATFDVKAFRAERERLNEGILKEDHLGVKRFFNLDTRAYEDGALDTKTKELLGLVASTVLRCNDCIVYHLDQLVRERNATKEELMEALNIALVVGGSIVIPHFRTAWDAVEQLIEEREGKQGEERA